MWWKNLKYFSVVLFILFTLTSCGKKAENENRVSNSVESPTVIDSRKNNVDLNDTIRNTIFKNSTITKVFGSKYISNTTFENCIFTSDNLGFGKLSNVTFDGCTFINENVEIKVLEAEDTKFTDCKFSSLWLKNSKIKNGLIIDNCIISEIVIDQTEFVNLSIISHNDTINKVRVQGASHSIGLSISGYINEVFVEGGDIQYLDVSNILNTNASMTVFSTLLKNPNFVNKSARNYSILFNSSIENATFLADENSILKEESEWEDKNSDESKKTNRTEIKKGYLVAKSVYSYLSKVFENEKKYALADYFYYRSKICENEISSNSSLEKGINKIWNEYFRGNYGTSYPKILLTYLYMVLIFSVLYIALGWIKISFGYYITTKLFGDTLENQKPIILTWRKNKFGLIMFIGHCLIFSLNSMVLGGLTNRFHLYNFTSMYLYPPRRYGSIGMGKYFSLIQSIIGLILVFFFISAFVRINR